MSVLAALDVTKSYGERLLLDRVAVTIAEGERVGVVGRNGAGKSTLARILAGVEPPDGGSLAVRRGARVAYLAQEPTLEPTRTVRHVAEEGLAAWSVARTRHEDLSRRIASGEHVEALVEEQVAVAAEIERLGGWDRSHEVERVLERLGLGDVIDRTAGTLSGGQKRRAALAQVLVGAPDVMILDEPTNHLDADTIDWLERYLVEELRGAVVLVTHDRWLLDRVADRTLEVDAGAVHAYDGGYAEFLAAKAERLAIAERTERNRKNFLRTELEWLRRQPKARTGKQKARIQRAEAAKAIEAPREDAHVVLSADVAEAGRSILDVRGLALRTPDGRPLVEGLDLSLTSGERLGILGPNGAGKTTLLRAILGEVPPASGAITLGRRVRVAYLDQQRAGLDPDVSVLECVERAVPSVESERVDPRTYLERFAFEGSAQKKKVGGLSGGERARLALARLLASAANLLLLDEPTNDLDTDTLSALEDFLSTYEGSLLVVTHDRYFLDRVTTGILCFERDARVTRYAGSYQAYAAARAREEEKLREAREAAKAAARPRTDERAKPTGLSKNEQRELDGIMDRIDEAERAAAAIEAELGDPTLYTSRDDDRAAAIRARLAEARDTVAKLTARWEALETKRGGG